MWDVIFYTRPNGRKPAQEWIQDQEKSIQASIDTRINRLRIEGPLLVESRRLVPIRKKPKHGRPIHGFYELRDLSKKWRIAVYHDVRRSAFVLISGWRKLQPVQKDDVDKAIRLLDEYLRYKEKVNGWSTN